MAGKNFGCGSSREQAASCLKGHELIDRGAELRAHLPAELDQPRAQPGHCPAIEATEGDELEIAPDAVRNKTTGRSFAIVPLPKARQAIIDAGGLIPYTRKRVLEAAGRA